MNDKKDKHTGVGGRIMRIICPVLAVAAVAAVFIYSYITGEELTVANLVEHAPAQAGVAAAVMILIYIIKSLTVFFPVTVLYAAGGYIFGPVVGCAVNCAGIAAGCAVQYWMGKASGSGAAAKLAEKHPRISAVFTAQDRSPLFAALSARLFGVISGDIISYYFGASGVHFLPFLIGSICGVLPGLVTVTVLGTSATDPSSPAFIISVAAAVVIFAASALGKYIIEKKHRKKDKTDSDSGDGEGAL